MPDLESLPPVICNISSLKKLRLGGNDLTSLPKTIGKLKNLELLTLWTNNLSALPDEIGQLVNLKALDLSSNDALSALPEEVGQLVNLKTLDLPGDALVRLPESIVGLSKLEEFFWDGSGDKILTAQQERWLKNLHAKGCRIYIDGESMFET